MYRVRRGHRHQAMQICPDSCVLVALAGHARSRRRRRSPLIERAGNASLPRRDASPAGAQQVAAPVGCRRCWVLILGISLLFRITPSALL